MKQTGVVLLGNVTQERVKETDLYEPIAEYFTQQGYTVRGEVNGCDIAAIKGNELIMVELKRTFGVELLIQATRRQRAADSVYVAIPRPVRGLMGGHWQGVLHVLRRLELGLILVDMRSSKRNVEIALNPVPFERRRQMKTRQAAIKEINGRSVDLNLGGSRGTELMTAYRENALLIASLIDSLGTATVDALKKMGTGEKTARVLYDNVYGWFSREGRATYILTSRGKEELSKYPELTQRFFQVASATPQIGDDTTDITTIKDR